MSGAAPAGVFLDDRPDSRGTIVAPEAPAGPVGLGDIFGAHWRLGQQDHWGSEQQAELDAYGPIVTAMEERGPKNWLGLSDRRYLTFSRQNAWVNDQMLWADVAEERRKDPDFLKDVPATNGAEFSEWVKANELKRRRAAQDIVSRERGVGQTLFGFGSDVVAGLTDPINIGVMAVTGGAGAATTIWRGMAREALINGATEVAELPIIAGNRQRFGEELTPEEAALSVGAAAVGGAVVHAVPAGAKALAKAAADTPAARAAGRALAPIALSRARLAEATDGEVARAFADAVPAEYRTPDQAAALHVIERDAEIEATTPFARTPAADDAHNAKLAQALADLLASGTGKPQLRGSTAIASGTVPTFVPRETSAPVPRPDLSPDRVVRFVMRDLEGGAQVVHYSDADGGVTKYGIAAKHNPGVDVANLTEAEAASIARRKYWFRELDRADPRTAAVAFDAGYISGPEVGKRILAESGGDPARALALYRARLNRIADTVPGKAKYRKGWNARVDKLERRIGMHPDDRVTLDAARLTDDVDDVATSQRALDEADFDARMLAAERAVADRGELGPRDAGDLDVPEASALVDDDLAGAPEPVQDGDGGRQQGGGEPFARSESDDAAPATLFDPQPSPIAPEVQRAVRDYVTQTRGSLLPEKMGKALGIAPEEAERVLGQLVSDPGNGLRLTRTKSVIARRDDGTIIYEKKGKGRSAKMVPQRTVKAGKIVRRARSGPSDLLRFIAERGGLRDDQGFDLAAGRNLDMFVPQAGPLLRKGGMSIDEAREAAAEAGYFVDLDPETAWSGTSEADFLDLIEQARHRPIYSREDTDWAARREEDAERAEALASIKQEIDYELAERGFSFGREQRDRAADLMLQGYRSDEAVARVVAEDVADALDAAIGESDYDGYERAFDEIEHYFDDGDGRAPPRDDGWGIESGDPGTREADLDQYRGAELDEREELGLNGPPPLDGGRLRDFDDPDGAGAQAQAESLAHDLKATIKPDAVDGSAVLGWISGVKDTGEPGISVYDPFGDNQVVNATFRDPEGVAKANVFFPLPGSDMRANGYGVITYVDPAFRRQGIATKLYDALRDAGHDIDQVSGSGDLTPDGAAFASARRRASLDRGPAIDPAIADRQRQGAQLKAASPMRAKADQEGTIGLGLFDATDQFRLDVEGGERSLGDILKDVEADEAAIKAARDCL